jgi:hypothetical protein
MVAAIRLVVARCAKRTIKAIGRPKRRNSAVVTPRVTAKLRVR